MTVLSIAQNVAKRVGFNSPSSLVGNSDEIAIQVLALIEEETRALSDRFRWQALVKRGTFNFVPSQEAYSLPSDFKDFIPDTIWNNSTRRPLIAPTTPEDYEIQKNYLVTSGIDKMVYVYGDSMYITPVPGSTDTIVYEYTTLNIFKDNSLPAVGKPAITQDTDTTTIREYLVELGVKLRYMTAKGMILPGQIPSSFEFLDYEAQIQRAIVRDGFGRKKMRMSNSANAYWKAAYTQDSNYPTG